MRMIRSGSRCLSLAVLTMAAGGSCLAQEVEVDQTLIRDLPVIRPAVRHPVPGSAKRERRSEGWLIDDLQSPVPVYVPESGKVDGSGNVRIVQIQPAVDSIIDWKHSVRDGLPVFEPLALNAPSEPVARKSEARADFDAQAKAIEGELRKATEANQRNPDSVPEHEIQKMRLALEATRISAALDRAVRAKHEAEVRELTLALQRLHLEQATIDLHAATRMRERNPQAVSEADLQKLHRQVEQVRQHLEQAARQIAAAHQEQARPREPMPGHHPEHRGQGHREGDGFVLLPEPHEHIPVAQRRGRLLRTKHPVGRFISANPDTADVIQIGPTELFVVGRRPGVTTIVLWTEGRDETLQFLVECAPVDDPHEIAHPHEREQAERERAEHQHAERERLQRIEAERHEQQRHIEAGMRERDEIIRDLKAQVEKQQELIRDLKEQSEIRANKERGEGPSGKQPQLLKKKERD